MKLTIFFIAAVLFVPASTLLRHIDFHSLDQLAKESKWLVVLLFYTDGCGACETAKTEFKLASQHFFDQENLYFAAVDIHEDRLLAMRFQVEDVPLVKYLPYSSSAVGLRGGLNEANIVKVIRGAQTAGRMQPLNKKSAAHATHRNAHVLNNMENEGARIIAAMDYEKVVLDTSMHVFLALFVPECQEKCGIFDQASTIFKNEEHILLVKLDVSKAPEIANHFQTTRNPTIVFFPKQNKEYGQRYDNENLNLYEFVSFINENCGTHRQKDGKLAKNAGRIPVFDKIIHENAISIVTGQHLNYVINLIKDESEGLPHAKRYIDYYLYLLQEIKSGKEAVEILQEENDKSIKKLKDAKLSPEQKDMWRKYFNIIASFVESAATNLKTEHLEAEEKIIQENHQQTRRVENTAQNNIRGQLKTHQRLTLGQRVRNEL